MAQTLKTSGDYTIITGAGATGTNQIDLDSKTVRVRGDLIVDGDQTIVNTATLSVEDTFIELARNNSGSTLDAGIYVNRGTAGDNAVLYWDASDVAFKAATTTDSAGTSPLTSTTLANIRVAEPSDPSDAATKYYVNQQISGGGAFTLRITGDDSTVVSVDTDSTILVAGDLNISTTAYEPDTIKIQLNQNLNNINSISNGSTNGDLTLSANGTGSVIVNNILTFNSNVSTPSATAITKLYNKTVGNGGTGVFFVNSSVNSGTEGELISKKKARAYAIALG
jgi:hypothetical protein